MSTVFAICAAICAFVATFLFAHAVLELAAEKRRGTRQLSLEEVLADKTLSFALFASCGAVIAYALALWMVPIAVAVGFLLSRKAPDMLQRRRLAALRSACEGQLDVMADVVAMGVRAGLSFDAALGMYCGKFSCELSGRMESALLAWQSGMATRTQALGDAARELDSLPLRRFADTACQAIRYGSPLSELLSAFADDVRRERRSLIEQQVAKAPVKMLVPLSVCILPALLIFVMGPVVLQFLGSGM